MAQIIFYATILDADFSVVGDFFNCIKLNASLEQARMDKDWDENKDILNKNIWTSELIEDITITFTPENKEFPASIYKLEKRSQS